MERGAIVAANRYHTTGECSSQGVDSELVVVPRVAYDGTVWYATSSHPRRVEDDVAVWKI